MADSALNPKDIDKIFFTKMVQSQFFMNDPI